MILTKTLHRHLSQMVISEKRRRFIVRRLAETLAAMGCLLLDDILKTYRVSRYKLTRDWEELMLAEAQDPHISRRLLLEETELGGLVW